MVQMNMMIIKSVLVTLAVSAAISSCGKSDGAKTDGTAGGQTVTFPDYSGLTVKTLEEKSPRVYWGFDNKWHDIASSANRPKWEYTREHLTGFYTNFIDMWCMNFQNSKTAGETCKELYETFVNKNAFFEATMETKVNDGANGYNNEETDRRTIDQLTSAGFNVDYASVNYMTVASKDYCKQRMNLIATYKGTRKCFYLCGPWTMNGSIFNDKDALEMAGWGDGIETDGPLGFWYSNQGKMKECSYSIVKYMKSKNLETAIMLAPYSADVSGYTATTKFLQVSKDCVLGHEDNNAAPEIWTLWMYGSGGLELFPETTSDETGNVVPANTATGVAWWLLKHLNEFPKASASNATDAGNGVYSASVENGKTIEIPVTFSNGNCPGVELSPVLRAVYDTSNPDWDVMFKVGSTGISNSMIFNGGFNCINSYRITCAKPLTVTACFRPKKASASLTVSFEAMSNLSNTASKKTVMTLKLTGK